MKAKYVLVAASFLFACAWLEAEEDPVVMLETRVQKCAQSLLPAVVVIQASRTLPTSASRPARLTSGVIVSAQGYVITLASYPDKGDRLQVVLSDGRCLPAKLRGCDYYSNLALVKVDEQGLPAVKWGDSDKLEVGSFVLAAGNPYGLSGSVSIGIVGGLRRKVAGYPGTLIQASAPVNPGDAGGLLANLKGEAVGIIYSALAGVGPRDLPLQGYPGMNLAGSAWRLPQAISFAIPSNTVRKVVDELTEKGRVDWGYLGVLIRSIDERPQAVGVEVLKCSPGSPAAKAGILAGDIITSFTSSRNVVTSFRGSPRDCPLLQELVLGEQIGKEITLALLRQGRELELKVRVGTRQPTNAYQGRPVGYRQREGKEE